MGHALVAVFALVLLVMTLPALYYTAARPRALSVGAERLSAHADLPADLEAAIAAKLAESRLNNVRETFLEQNELVYLDALLPESVVDAMIAEVNALRPFVRRKTVPLYKSSGSVSYYRLLEHAPVISAVYRSPALRAWLKRVTGATLEVCPDTDPHAAALYYYTQPGDRIGFHYDSSHYAGARYTVLIGLVDRSTSRLVCQLYKDDPDRETVELRLATKPGMFILFNGDNLYHSVSPLGHGEERVVLTYEYLSDTRISPLRKRLSDLKDAMTYFGLKEVLGPPKTARNGRASA